MNNDYFNLLRKIENNPESSQRELANELGFSLGKLNYCLRALKEKGFIKIQNFKPVRDNKYAFIFGNEVDGIQDEIINVSDEVVEIPQVGTKHSLNVSVAAGIVLWDFFYKTEI